MQIVRMKLRWKILRENAEIPKYHSEGASGFDLKAYVKDGPYSCMTIPPGGVRCIPTGLAVEIPKGIEMQIRPRSGLSLETKLRLPNSPGTIDCDYRGEVGILVENTSTTQDLIIRHGERIAQGVLVPVFRAEHEIVGELSETTRGGNGFGRSPENGYA